MLGATETPPVKTPEQLKQILGQLRLRLDAIYGDRLQGLYLYGSYARSEARPGSDLDVLAVLEPCESAWEEIQRTSRVNAELSLQHDITISLLFTSLDRWRHGDDAFVSTVRCEGQAA